MKEKTGNLIVVGMVILMITGGLTVLFAVVFPVDAKWNKDFESHATMAKDQATFEGMEDQIQVLWGNMNTSFKGKNLNETYSTWWYPDQTYDNSLGAQRDYFAQLLKSIQRYKQTYSKMLANGTTPTMLEDWYYKSIQNLRNEMNREGGLCWALKDAWYYNLHPTNYWLPFWMIPLYAFLSILTIGVWMKTRR